MPRDELALKNRTSIRKLLNSHHKYCIVNDAGGQNIPIGVLTPVNFLVTIAQSTRPEWADLVNNRITPTIPGVYLAIGWCYWASNNAGFRYAIWGGSGILGVIPNTTRHNAIGTTERTAIGLVYFNGTTDYITFQVYQNAVNPLSLPNVFFGIVKL